MNTTENKFYDDWSENLYGERGIADVNIKKYLRKK